VVTGGWGTGLVLRQGVKTSGSFEARASDSVSYDTYTQALVDELEKGSHLFIVL
jgi:hypothetical protein